MTNEHLQISYEELIELKKEYPLEVEMIMNLLSEAGEDLLETNQVNQPIQSVA